MAAKKRGGTARRRGRLWLGKRARIGGLVAMIALVGALMIPGSALLERVMADDGAGEALGLRISEVMSENQRTLITDTGDVPDWVEIVNTLDEGVALEGWTLVLDSKPNRPFCFPQGVLGPGERALIYATGETAGAWNAPFRLNASGGESLALLGPGGKAVDAVTLPELSADESYCQNDNGTWELSIAPTPGAAPGSSAALSELKDVSGAVELTEVMSGNSLYCPDEDGEYCDYVELHNASGANVDLRGWYLSDDPARLKRWRFPAVTLPADGYLIVYCSGKDRASDPERLHTNFKLSSEGEEVYLCDSDGRMVSQLSAPALMRDQAWSLFEGEWSAELAPTPGMENSRAAAALVQSERFDGALDGAHISEIVAVPSREEHDWIELYNGSAQSVDLSGWGLSDDTARPRRWQFPQGTSIGPGQYLPVMLTGDPSITNKNYICADFALGAAGGYTVCLSDDQGQVLDAVYLGTQYGGVPYARYTGEQGFRYGAMATLQAANSGASYLDRAPMPTASVQGGLHVSGERFTVELRAPADCQIYYTLDCSAPDEGSTLYTGPIEISGTTILRSRAYRAGSLPSFIAAQSYLYDVSVPEGVYVVSLVADPDDLYSDERGILVKGPNAWAKFPYGEINNGANFWMDWEREANVELFTSDGQLGFAQPCGIKLHGQYSRASEVKAFKVFARSEYGDNRFDYPIFSGRDYDSYQSFLLRASGQDYNRTFMRDSVLCALAKDTSVMYQETEIGVCYLNGEYYSLFNLRERVSRFSICQFEGWEGMEDDIDLIKANDIEKEGSNKSMEELLKWIKDHDTTTQEAYDYIAERIDMRNYIEYMALQIFSGNGDTLNVKRYRNPKTDGKWRWVIFDLDWAFSVDTNSIHRWLDPEGMGTGKYTDTTLFIGCMKNPIFRDQFLSYMGEQLSTTFSTENVLARFEERYKIIEPLLPEYFPKVNINENTYRREMNTLVAYARTRPKKLIGYFQGTLKLSDADMTKYFGAALEKIQAFEEEAG